MSSKVPNQHVDFDLHIKDYNKLLVLVRNLLDPAASTTCPSPSSKEMPRVYDCDCFDERECHHLNAGGESETTQSAHYTTRRMDKCLYCRFVDFLKVLCYLFKHI